MMKLKDDPTTSFPKKLAFKTAAISPPKILAILFTLVVIWIQGATIFPSGRFDKNHNLVFYNYVLFHDANVHLSLIGELSQRFPPTNFSTGGTPLKNYHYLFDAAIAGVYKITGISTLDLYFRIVPVILSSLLSLVIYQTILTLSRNRLAAAFGIFFAVFATSFGFLMPAVKDLLGARLVTGASNLFMTDQLLNMLVNPQGQLSLILFLSLFLFFAIYEGSRKTVTLIPLALLLGLSFGVKAYGGIIFAPAALLSGLYFAIRSKDWRLLLAVLCGLAIMALWIFATVDNKAAGLKFAPFWTLDRMMSDLDKLNDPRFLLLKQYYASVHAWWRIGLLNIRALLIYVIGSLGFRLLGFLAVIKILARPSKISPSQLFLLVASLFSLAIPLLFNQTKKAYDVVQFTPYFTIFMGIMFTVALFDLLGKIKNGLRKVIILVLLLVIFLFADAQEILPRFQKSGEEIIIAAPVIEAVEFAQKKTPPNSVFLLAPSPFNRSYLWFTGLAKRRTAYSGLDFAFQIGQDTAALEQDWLRLFSGVPIPTHYDYIFVPQKEEPFFAKMSAKAQFVTVFDNSQVRIAKKISP